MSTETATTAAGKTTDAAVNKAAKAAAVTAAAVSETLPTVVETAEIAMEVPAKVVLNQKLVVTAAVVSGIAIGAVGLWGANKLRARLAAKKLEAEIAEATAATVEADEN